MNNVFEVGGVNESRPVQSMPVASIWSSSVKENTQTTTTSQQRQDNQSTVRGERREGGRRERRGEGELVKALLRALSVGNGKEAVIRHSLVSRTSR